MRLIKPSFELLPHLEYAAMLKLVCQAITQCYKAPMPKGYKEQEDFIAARIKMGHESVIEHVGFSALLTVDRGIANELVRHRLCSFSQESTRYCNYQKDKFDTEITYVMPKEISDQIPEGSFSGIGVDALHPTICQQVPQEREIRIDQVIWEWVSGLLQSELTYFQLLNLGKAPEFARGVLPLATATSIVVTANMREWRHIFRLRALGTTGRPHPQMVEIMTPLLEEAMRRFPVFFSEL